IDGSKIVVTRSPVFIEPTYGGNSFAKDYIEKLLGPSQAQYVHALLKTSYESLVKGDLRRAPVLVLVGERDHGKSLFVQSIIVPLLGGRQGRPQQFMNGLTTFNVDLMGSEV